MERSDYIQAVHDEGELAATVTVYPAAEIDRASSAARAFRAAVMSRLLPGMALSSGPTDTPASPRSPLATISFQHEHVPVPLEEILDWLRGEPLVRVIEIDRYGVKPRVTYRTLQQTGDLWSCASSARALV